MPYTLGQYRHRLADAAGFNIVTQTTAAATVSNQVVVSDFQSTELETTFLGNTWEYQPTGPNAGQVRRVVYGGLSSGTGTIALESNHATPTPSGTPVEFYGRLPPVRREGRLGLNDIVNKVLAECWTIQRLAIPGVTNQRVYPLGTLAPWLMAEDQVVEVFYRGAGAQPADDDQLMLSWRWMSGADNPGIEIGSLISTGDTLKIQVYVPMSWWINVGGAGFALATTEGLQAESDQAILPIMGMEIIGQAYVNLEMSKWGLPDDQKQFMALRAQARAAANQWKRLTLEHPRVRKYHWPSSLSVQSRDNYSYGSSLQPRG